MDPVFLLMLQPANAPVHSGAGTLPELSLPDRSGWENRLRITQELWESKGYMRAGQDSPPVGLDFSAAPD